MLVSLPSLPTRLRQPRAGKEGLATADHKKRSETGARGRQDLHPNSARVGELPEEDAHPLAQEFLLLDTSGGLDAGSQAGDDAGDLSAEHKDPKFPHLSACKPSCAKGSWHRQLLPWF